MKMRIVLTFLLGALFCMGSRQAFASPEWPNLDMVKVPAGTFQMGSKDSPRSMPVHTVTLTNDFYMSKYEITGQQYADMLTFANSKGHLDKGLLTAKGDNQSLWAVSKSPHKCQDITDNDSVIYFKDGVFKVLPGKENDPIVEVTWYGAAFFCNMLSEKEGLTPLYNLDDWSCQVYGKTGYRLATEAEWEYAARFDDGRKYPWGNQEPDKTLVNGLNYYYGVKPVGTCSPKGDSKLGISDLAGNVAEWVNDWYLESYTDTTAVTDPVGPGPSFTNFLKVFNTPSPMRVMRGGSCLCDPDFRKGMGEPFVLDYMVHPDAITTTFRSYSYPDISDFIKGFRVVKTVATDKAAPAFSAADKNKPVYGVPSEYSEPLQLEGYPNVMSYGDQLTNSLGTYTLTVYYPSQTEKDHSNISYPAVIFAPGGKLVKEAYRWVGAQIANEGFIVLIFSVPTKDEFGTKERVEGFKSMIGYLAAKNAEPGHILKGKVNTDKIAVGGHSLGGRSVYEFISGNQKPVAAFILSSQCETPEMAKKISIPVQLQIGDADTFVKPENALASYNDLGSAAKEYLQIAGADHLQFINMRKSLGAASARQPVTTAKISREEQQKISAKYFLAWLCYYLKGDTKYSDTIFGNGVKDDLKSGVLSDYKIYKK